MADISTEIAAIEAAANGEDLRQPLIDALDALNDGSLPAVDASDAGKILKVDSNGEWVVGEKSGYMPVPSATKEITENGTYDVTDYASAAVQVSGGGVSISTDYIKTGVLIPVMTSNNTPSGVASSSSTLNSSFNAYRAFDGVNTQSSMQGGWLAAANDSAPWIAYEFPIKHKLDKISIYTANNSTTTSKDVYIEGFTDNEQWENCLKNSETATLQFIQGTYGTNVSKFNFELNGNEYKKFRIRGTSAFYGGTNQYACTFDQIQIFSQGSGTLPGIGYYTEQPPTSELGINGNICVDTMTGIVYQKENGAWSAI